LPLNRELRKILLIGSGPVVIGQAAEFDYSGSQASLAVRDEGLISVLLNPNPATIQTDRSIADRIYIEPIDIDIIKMIVDEEGIDAVISSVGGQTALNMAMEMHRSGMFGPKLMLLGTSPEDIEKAENRTLFHELMKSIGEPVPESFLLDFHNYEETISKMQERSYIVRTSFSLGGSGGTIVDNLQSLRSYCDQFFSENPRENLEVEQSIQGLVEVEYEMIRDSADNCISICNMENLDPMGVHTGESIVVTPSQTLSDIEIQMLRTAAIKIVRSLHIVGACNIQFAIDPNSERYYVVEVNPRTSRSSALASKATGYPIARISTKILLGYTLPEIKNPLTKDTSAAFEPSLDYITVKIPRWPFDKISSDRKIGVQMRSVGEVMGIGATFEEALMKAIASLDTTESRRIRLYKAEKDLVSLLENPNDLRIFAIFDALISGIAADEISKLTGYSIYFIHKMQNIVQEINKISIGSMPENLHDLKNLGVSDSIIAHFSKLDEFEIVKHRLESGMLPSYRVIDTCSAEFLSSTPYLYSTYQGSDDLPPSPSKKKVIVLGSGPIRISQGLEFDYGSVKATRALISAGFETIMVNSNPETVSTDFDFSNRLYFEPLTLEHVANIIHREGVPRIMVQFSGQTGQNMAMKLADLFGDEIFLGTSPSEIYRIEERTKFASAIKSAGLLQPPFVIVRNEIDSETVFERIKLPVIIRSSFIIGGRSMDIVYDLRDGIRRIKEILTTYPEHPVLISEYLSNSVEMDVDFISDGSDFLICGISVHLEEAGTHSGDAISILGPSLITDETRRNITEMVGVLVREFRLKGISNLQVASNSNGLYIIELNARSSRSIPYVSKASGIDIVKEGINMALGIKNPSLVAVEPRSYFCKIPIFPFKRFPESDILLSPEMKSTGEGLGIGITQDEALAKAFRIQNPSSLVGDSCIVSVAEAFKPDILDIVKLLKQENITIFATPGTHAFLKQHGIRSVLVFKIGDKRRPTLRDIFESQDIFAVINVPDRRGTTVADGFEIRRMALGRNIPVLTNINSARALISSLLKKPKMKAREIVSYY
jgi:carbamoyl-phosphate synthase large subunit